MTPLQRLDDAIGKRVLVWSEQGLGDTLQFCRYVPLLIAKGAHVVFAVQTPLKDLIAANIECPVIDAKETQVDADYQVPLLSLPLLYNTLKTSIPAPVGYLQPNAELVLDWQKRLDLSPRKLNVLIACSGNAQQTNDLNRSMPLEMFDALCDTSRLFLIQKDVRQSDQAYLALQPEIQHIGQLVQGFANMAAVAESMDLVISVDSSPAHLAAALGKKVFLLQSFATEWRWMQDLSDSPWYPTVTVFRQRAAGDWASVMDTVVAEVAALAPGKAHLG
jgi:hypothetical protein